jgi:hypothetical protein
MDAKQAVEKLAKSSTRHHERIMMRFIDGEYRVRDGQPPDEYNEHYSEICWGWLISGPQTDKVVATFAMGERGDDDYDPDLSGLTIWTQSDDEANRNANLERAAKALVSKLIGFSEFKRIVRENS